MSTKNRTLYLYPKLTALERLAKTHNQAMEEKRMDSRSIGKPSLAGIRPSGAFGPLLPFAENNRCSVVDAEADIHAPNGIVL